MRHLLAIFCTASLVAACGGGDNTDTDTDTDVGCQNSILATFPGNATPDVYYRSAVRFTLAESDGTAVISLVDSAGTAVNGTQSAEGTIVSFQPDAPLANGATYTASLTYVCGTADVSWTVSGVGEPLADPTTIEGNKYSLDLANGEFVEPPGIGPLIQTEMDEEILIGVVTSDGTNIELMGALGDGMGQQDFCNPSIEFPVAASFSENPYFIVKSDELIMEIEGFEIIIEDMEVSGAFAPDATYIEGAVLAGTADTRPMVELIAPGGDDKAVCDLMAVFLVNCEPCADGTGEFCMTVYVDNMRADQATGDSLIVWTETDVEGMSEIDCPPETTTGTL